MKCRWYTHILSPNSSHAPNNRIFWCLLRIGGNIMHHWINVKALTGELNDVIMPQNLPSKIIESEEQERTWITWWVAFCSSDALLWFTLLEFNIAPLGWNRRVDFWCQRRYGGRNSINVRTHNDPNGAFSASRLNSDFCNAMLILTQRKIPCICCLCNNLIDSCSVDALRPSSPYLEKIFTQELLLFLWEYDSENSGIFAFCDSPVAGLNVGFKQTQKMLHDF